MSTSKRSFPDWRAIDSTNSDSVRYRGFADSPAFALGDNLVLVHCPLTGATQAISVVAHRLLQACRTCVPLEEHCRRICTEFRLPPVEVAPVQEQLATLVAARLLVPHQRLLEALGPPVAADPLRITTIGIPTRDRAASLEHCLNSLATAIRRGADAPEILVVDDSTQADQQAANRRTMTSLRGTYPGPLAYAGTDAKERFARRLADHAGLDYETAAFALVNLEGCPITTGTSRNALLLDAAGTGLLQLDDDTFCCLASAPDACPGLVATSHFDGTEFWFPAADSQPSAPFVPQDLLAIHEELLGKSPGAVLAALPRDVEPDLDGAALTFFRPTAGRVRLTAAGVAGDSGMSSSVYFLLLEGESRARLHRTEAVYRDTLARHQLWRAVTRPTLVHGATCQALNLGLDLRRPLPPFLPVQRNQDGIFCTLVKTCCSDAYVGLLPFLLRHEAPQRRVLTAVDLHRTVTGMRTDVAIQLLIRSCAACCTGTEERNLQAVGEGLVDLAARPLEEFTATLRRLVWEQMSGLSRQCAALLEKHGSQPSWWAADLRKLLTDLRGRLAEPDYVIPQDLAQAFGPGAALPLLQRLTGRLGRLLQCWPALFEAARDLRARGVRLAEPR
jgi:hypothetical protein